MSTPTDTVAEALHAHVSSTLATIDAGLPSDRALREPTGDAMTAEVMLMQEVRYGGPLTRQGLDIAAHRALASLAQHRDDITRVLDQHSEAEVDDHGNVRCTCAETAWFDDVLMHHDHVTFWLLAYLTGGAS